jgi:hypothetical protein
MTKYEGAKANLAAQKGHRYPLFHIRNHTIASSLTKGNILNWSATASFQMWPRGWEDENWVPSLHNGGNTATLFMFTHSIRNLSIKTRPIPSRPIHAPPAKHSYTPRFRGTLVAADSGDGAHLGARPPHSSPRSPPLLPGQVKSHAPIIFGIN